MTDSHKQSEKGITVSEVWVSDSNSGMSSVLFEVSNEFTTDNSNRSLHIGSTTQTIDSMLSVVREMSGKFSETFNQTDASEIEVEYGLNLNTQAGFSCWAVAETAKSSSITIKMKWKRNS